MSQEDWTQPAEDPNLASLTWAAIVFCEVPTGLRISSWKEIHFAGVRAENERTGL